ncbi:MAG: thioredoxin domain-containing protein [Candidatus Eisenbacteria bacterium]|nr:thioredoxin domain-containing protein [Candidatus Eisenbacteria bacterium]
MLRRISRAAAWLVLILPAAALASDDVPWDLIDGGADLKGVRKEAAAEVLASAKCYGGCEGTILSCLSKSGGDPIARRLAAFVVRRVKADRDPEEILKEIEDRRLSAFPEKPLDPDVAKTPLCGDAKAPIRVVLYADFGCPYCKATATALRDLVQKDPKRIAYYFKNYPLKSNDRAVPAARALLAAEKQGKFWEMHDFLFANDKDLSDAAIEAGAKKVGLDLARFRADQEDPSVVERLRAEKMEGIRFGVKKTPGILVNGKPYRGVRTWEELFDRIEEERDLLDVK